MSFLFCYRVTQRILVIVSLCFVLISVHFYQVLSMMIMVMTYTTTTSNSVIRPAQRIIRIQQNVWRQAALDHQEKIRALVEPGMVAIDDEKYLLLQTSSRHRQQRHLENFNSNINNIINNNSNNQAKYIDNQHGWCRALDPKHPVYNFLIEYYGLKGVKGTKRLARWAPSPNLLLQPQDSFDNLKELLEASNSSSGSSIINGQGKETAILLEGATSEDMGCLLHLRGSMFLENMPGVLYSPSLFFGQKMDDYFNNLKQQKEEDNLSKFFSFNTSGGPSSHPSSAFLWYRSILQQTLQAEPILHCYGLHEWAMQYHPPGSDPPPSAKYQGHLPLRVTRDVINETVERRGVSCTHVDALRFFAPAAAPLNHHGASLKRMDQLRLEQPACVHAHMDLLKIALRLQPFCDASMLQRILQVALESRTLDVAASPYDATAYGVGVIPIESPEGRAQYRREQMALMQRVKPIRQELLNAYDSFLYLAFGKDAQELETCVNPAAERFARAEPGGKPWRRNLISS